MHVVRFPFKQPAKAAIGLPSPYLRTASSQPIQSTSMAKSPNRSALVTVLPETDMVKLKILFVLLQLDAGGSERVALDLARQFTSGGFEVYLAAFKGGALETAFREVCREIFFINKKPGIDFSSMWRLSQIIGQYRIDVVNAHHYMPCFYSFPGACVLHKRRLIYTEHSAPEVESICAGFHGKLLNLMLHRIYKVVGVSRLITETFIKGYPRHTGRFVTILNGVEAEKFYQPQFREEVRRQFGFTREHYVVGTVANFRNIKNHACIVRAAARLKDSCPHVRFLFVGTGFPGDSENSEETIRLLISKHQLEDRVVLAGYQENIPAMLASLDAFCLASFSEGLPVSILEAMAAGLPVIGSKVNGIQEVVDNQITGLLFANNNDKELTWLIENLAQGKIAGNRLIENAFVFLKDNHSYSKVYGEYCSLVS